MWPIQMSGFKYILNYFIFHWYIASFLHFFSLEIVILIKHSWLFERENSVQISLVWDNLMIQNVQWETILHLTALWLWWWRWFKKLVVVMWICSLGIWWYWEHDKRGDNDGNRLPWVDGKNSEKENMHECRLVYNVRCNSHEVIWTES